MIYEPTDWTKLDNSKTYKAISKTFFIVKDANVDINWKKPLL